MGFDAKAYTSYNFVKGPGCPVGLTVAEQMAAAADDAVDLLVVVNQNGAQNSNSTIGVVYDDIRTYLASEEGAKWNATIIGRYVIVCALVLGLWAALTARCVNSQESTITRKVTRSTRS
jgi:hypothetical protein